MSWRVHFMLIGLIAMLGCSPDVPSYTQYGVPVDLGVTGNMTVPLAASNDEQARIRTALVDTMAPISMLDNAVLGMAPPTTARHVQTLELLHQNGPDALTVRARFSDVPVIDGHLCDNLVGDAVPAYCDVGLDSDRRDIHAVLGVDLLSRNAVRFDMPGALMSFLPDIAGSVTERTRRCDGVFTKPFHGGGTLVIGGTEISFSASRIAIDACFFNDECPIEGERCALARPTNTDLGVDALFVVSTGLGISIVSRSTYERYVYMRARNGEDLAPAYDALPAATLHLLSGAIDVRLAKMNHLALVAESSDERGPCGERYMNDYLVRNRVCEDIQSPECMCPNDTDFCRVGAVAELSVPIDLTSHQGFDVAVVPDGEPILQALRNELRPELPEVSGILGSNALADLIVDVDYPNDRLLMRCDPGADDARCLIRPLLVSTQILTDTLGCLPEDMLAP